MLTSLQSMHLSVADSRTTSSYIRRDIESRYRDFSWQKLQGNTYDSVCVNFYAGGFSHCVWCSVVRTQCNRFMSVQQGLENVQRMYRHVQKNMFSRQDYHTPNTGKTPKANHYVHFVQSRRDLLFLIVYHLITTSIVIRR